MPLRVLNFGGKLSKTDSIVAGKSVTLNMERADGYKNVSYDFTFSIAHTNAAAIITDLYKFLKNFLLNIKFVTGAGDNLFDLSSTEMAIIHLVEQGRLRYSIDTTTGADKVSTIMLRWNFVLPKYYKNPLDTVFHSDNRKYNNVQVKITPQKTFDGVADCTINSIDLKVKEVFKLNPRPAVVESYDSKTQKVVARRVPALNKIIKVKDFGFNSDVTSQQIELPKDTTILGVYVCVVDENDVIKADGIQNISIKNGNTYFYDSSFEEANEDNRDNLKTWGNTLLDNVAFIDIAQGKMSEALNTASSEHSNTVLSFDLVASAGTNVLKVMYLTVEDA